MTRRVSHSVLEPSARVSAASDGAVRFRSIFTGKPVAEPRLPLSVYFATLVTSLLALVLPLTILQVYDRIIPNHAKETLFALFFGLCVALILDFSLKSARSALLSWLSTQFVLQVSDEAVARLLAAPAGTVERDPVATHINRYGAIGALGDYHAGPSRTVAIELPFVALGLGVMALVGGTMVLVPISLFLLFAALSIYRSRAFRDVIERRSVQDNKKYDFVTEVLSGILSVKAMAIEPQMQRRFERLQQAVANITAKSMLAGQAAQSSAVLFGNLSQVIVVMIGAVHVINDQMSIGALACCTMLSGQILQPLLRTISLWMDNQTVGHRRSEIRTLLSGPAGTLSGARRDAPEGPIVCTDAAFVHSADGSPLFSGITLEIPAGTIVGVKGEDGSGRSTLLNLLRGEIAPSAGSVRISGIATTDPEFARVRAQIAYVGPVPIIFRGTLLENLTLFQPERAAAARSACRLVGVDRTINLLPDGFETQLGEGIVDDIPVSVAQQVAIVRALACEPSILVLDDANSALDRTAEAGLIKALHALRGGMTVLVATHRPSLLATADLIIRVGDGTLACERSSPLPEPQRGVA
ncbi:peptidase domain-containing ABC transporter [Blastochloris sulfoviridis]|uniref:ATP-binding cassette domain-containing protein n=1 Tax=Blastochloris sulfoviridis TaxID=50712 RepID=A0A5M6HSV1_9HYPH|nr:ABC transporter transmembrane domain-containing protein [Blastochloris sulfoviridis]KAA5599003.1 ATP-binding cassette domain-containing protein [Blastochloris sulfoviridis]